SFAGAPAQRACPAGSPRSRRPSSAWRAPGWRRVRRAPSRPDLPVQKRDEAIELSDELIVARPRARALRATLLADPPQPGLVARGPGVPEFVHAEGQDGGAAPQLAQALLESGRGELLGRERVVAVADA